MKRILVPLLAVITLFAAAPLRAFEVESLALHIHLAGLSAGAAPEVVEDHLVFAVAGPYRFVGIAFAHEGWTRVHAFERNVQGTFVFAYPVPFEKRGVGPEPIRYRIVADGAWLVDPSNPRRIRDRVSGLELSVIDTPYRSRARLGAWDLLGEDGKTAHFRFEGESGQVVSVAGTFNNWDPFIHELEETSPGVYEMDLTLSAGEHRYVFWYRGERLPDELNPARLYDPEGRPVSVLSVARR